MTDQELLQAMSQMMDQKLEPIRTDIAEMKTDIAELKTDIAELKEGQEELRTGVNTLLDWAEKASMADTLPLPAIGE